MLTGKYRAGEERAGDTRFAVQPRWGDVFITERNLRIAVVLGTIAREVGHTASQVAIAWVRQQRQRGVIVPILGARSLAQLVDDLGALAFELTGEQLARLDQASRIELGFPHDFIAGGRQFAYGRTFDLIDDHRHPR